MAADGFSFERCQFIGTFAILPSIDSSKVGRAQFRFRVSACQDRDRSVETRQSKAQAQIWVGPFSGPTYPS